METLPLKNQEQSLSLNEVSEENKKYHRHNYEEKGNLLVCNICGKEVLNLKIGEKEGLLIGKKKDGTNYTVRNDRRRYFFPDEWEKFIKVITDHTHKFFFITALHTGGRAMEILNLRYKDIKSDSNGNKVRFSIVKQRKAKKNFFATGKDREFFVASNFIKEYKSFTRGRTPNPNHFIFLNNLKLPADYNTYDNLKRKKYYQSKFVSYSGILKRKLKKAGIEDWYNFSLHNLRKTYGMWMRTFNLEQGELYYRLGHDQETYLAHYGSSSLFTDTHRIKIAKIFGEVK